MKKLGLLAMIIFSAFCSCGNPIIQKIVEPKTVTFETNGGSRVEDQTVFRNQPVKRPADPSRNGYIFAEWYTDNGTFLREWNFAAIPSTDMTLYAKWIAEGVAVTSITVITQPTKLTYTHGEALDLAGLLVTIEYDDDTAEDAAFDQFESKSITANPAHGDLLSHITHNNQPVIISCGSETAQTNNLTVNPRVVAFTVDPIPSQEYAGSPLTPVLTVRDGGTILEPGTDYTVAYSNNDGVGTAGVNISGVGNYAGSSASAEFTISLKIFTVAFSADGGMPAPDQQSIGYGGTVNEPDAMTKTEHTFAGWYREAGFATLWNFADDTVSDDITLYAKWIINQYTVTFYADGGLPEPPPRIVDYGSKLSEPDAMTKADHTFAGWYREATFDTPWNFASDTVAGNTSLYARWIQNTATITISVEQVAEGVTIPAGTIVVSRTGANKTYTVTVSNPSDYSSITWEISGAGAYAGEKITGSGASFELEAENFRYNSLGVHTLRLSVIKDGAPYMVNIEFTIEG